MVFNDTLNNIDDRPQNINT